VQGISSRQRFESTVGVLGEAGHAVAVVHAVPERRWGGGGLGGVGVVGGREGGGGGGGGGGHLRLAPVEVSAVAAARRAHESVAGRILVVVVDAKKKRGQGFEGKAEWFV
jgi:hypothetical protein